MSTKQKYPRDAALQVAAEIGGRLRSDKMIIAGSLRRGKLEVGDVEILYVPRFMPSPRGDFFSTPPPTNVTEIDIETLRLEGILGKRPNVNGHFTWGQENKLAVHIPSGIPVDLFATTEDRWWVSLVIRTGGKETNLELTTGAQRLGRKLHAYGKGVEVLRTGEMLVPQSEREVFDFCGVKYRPPVQRQ